MSTSEDSSIIIQHSRKWDRAGLLASGICLVHCLAGPIAVLAYPALSHDSLFHSSVHLFLLPLVMAVAFLSFFSSYRQHLNKGPIFFGTLGIGLLLISFFWGEVAHSFDATVPAVFGSLILIASHLWNIRACHCFCAKSCGHSTQEHL